MTTHYQTGIDNPLTKRQKAVLVQLARKAYDKSGAAATGMDFQEWRHFMQENTIGKDSLTKATQADFRALRRAFELKSGQPVKALRTALTEGYEPLDQARHRLKQEIEKNLDVWEDPQLWAQGMLKRKRGTEDLNTASAEDLWHIIKTMSSRAAALRKNPPKPKPKTEAPTCQCEWIRPGVLTQCPKPAECLTERTGLKLYMCKTHAVKAVREGVMNSSETIPKPSDSEEGR